MENYFLIAAAAIILAVYFRRYLAIHHKSVKNLTVGEAREFIGSNKNIAIIDVRTKEEYKNGHIPGSKSIPVGEFSSRMPELQKYKDKPVLVYCASGGRSPKAVRILIKNHFSQIYHLRRGLMGWDKSWLTDK